MKLSAPMDVSLFDYELPPAAIAQVAVEPRDAARLLVVDRLANSCADGHVRDLPDLLRAGDLLVVNDTRVINARLRGTKRSGGRVELFVVEARPDGTFRVMLGASRAPRMGERIDLAGAHAALLIDGPGAGGEAIVRFEGPTVDPRAGAGAAAALLAAHGEPPLPPYIRRNAGDPRLDVDRTRYQTMFAARDGAVAAPTAGLHFTPSLVARCEAAGIVCAGVTLHVGEGTFRPVRAARTEEIALHAEWFDVPAVTADAIAQTRAAGGRIVAVGTTVVRTLESRPARADGAPEPGTGTTRLFIAPGHEFRFVDAMLTNFHLPRSTLLMLVSAFAGRERVLAAYAAAVARGYRFYSYGDAMLVL